MVLALLPGIIFVICGLSAMYFFMCRHRYAKLKRCGPFLGQWAFRMLSVTMLLVSSGAALALEELGPVSLPETLDGPGFRAIGWQWHYIDQNGKPGYMEKVASRTDEDGNELASYVRSDGCQWTRQVKGLAPATEWKNCPSSGKASVEYTGGTIWPLRVGNKFSYSVKGQSSLFAKVWGTSRQCTVTSAVRVRIISGEFDTFKVVCKERFGTRTWWLSPAIGTAVAYRHKPKRGAMVLQEYTHIEIGESGRQPFNTAPSISGSK